MTAVKFLQNSKVVGSSLETKKSFLLNKGLTSEEIEAAFNRLSSTSIPNGSSSVELLSQNIAPQNSLSSRLRDLLNVLLLIGGFSYGARYLWKVNLILPKIFNVQIWYFNIILEIYSRMAVWANQERKEPTRNSHGDLQCSSDHSRVLQRISGCTWLQHKQVLWQDGCGDPTTKAGQCHN